MAPKLEEVCIVKNVFIFDKIYLGLYMGLSQHLDISCGVISTKKLNLFVMTIACSGSRCVICRTHLVFWACFISSVTITLKTLIERNKIHLISSKDANLILDV